MTIPLLTTKLYIPPARPELVSRPRLIEQLNAGLDRKLTLISAPAGFGKTTLLSEWIHSGVSSREYGEGEEHEPAGEVSLTPYSLLPTPRFAWLSLDEGDNDAARFLAYFVAALHTLAPPALSPVEGSQVEGIEPDIGAGALGALQSPQPPPTEAILTVLINEIAAIPDRIVLVLNDYHVIESQAVDNALTFLLDHLPPQMHLVIASRADPPLPLSRLRARGQMTEIREADLRFTLDEVATFLGKVMGLNLSAENVAALGTRTEGWIAGLQLAALSMQGLKRNGDIADFVNRFTGSDRYIQDYLADEVLQRRPKGTRDFLLQTSILNRLSGPLCDAVRFGHTETPSSSEGTAVTGRKNSQAILEALEAANLFIVPLDNERRWYRYHHLFADLLRQRLHQTQPEQVPTLHHLAGEWHRHNGFIDDAIEHALRAEDFERAVLLIEENVDAIWQRGEHTKLRRWLAELPVELVFSKPHLCILHAWDLFTSGQHDAAERSLQAAEQALDTSTDRATETSPIERDQPPGSDRMKIQGRVAAIRAFLASYRGDLPGTIQYSRQALEYLPQQDSTWRSTATITLGDAYSYGGELAVACRARLEALEACKASGNIYTILIANLKVAVTLMQQGQLQRTAVICQQQLQLAQESGLSQTVVVGWLLAIWGEVLAELDDLDGANHQAKKGTELTERGRDVAMIGWSNLCLMRVLFSRGDMAGAEKIIQKMENIARKHDVPPWITNLMAAWQARLWLAQDKLTAASQWVQERGLDADGGPTLVHEMEYMVLARYLLNTSG